MEFESKSSEIAEAVPQLRRIRTRIETFDDWHDLVYNLNIIKLLDDIGYNTIFLIAFPIVIKYSSFSLNANINDIM